MNLSFRNPPAALVAGNESDLDARVALANPLPNERLALLALPDLVALRDQIATPDGPARSRAGTSGSRRLFRPLVLGAVLVLAAVGGIYGAWSAHTGWFGAPGYTESDTSQWLREDSPDIVGVVDKLTAKYTLPPGGSWNGLRKSYPRGPGYIQVTGIEGEVSMDAYCQWQHYWIVGYDTQDPAKMSAA